jgi:DNA-binding winged helix-turn-helix (wHTH) protein
VKSKHVILKEKLRDSLCKYQVMLDNELYKAMKALRDAQE